MPAAEGQMFDLVFPFIRGQNNFILQRQQIQRRSPAEPGANNGISKQDSFESAVELTERKNVLYIYLNLEGSVNSAPKTNKRNRLEKLVKL